MSTATIAQKESLQQARMPVDHGNDGRRFTARTIADLSAQGITRLTFSEMVEIVGTAHSYNSEEVRNLSTIESEALVRLVYLARQHCRQHA